jgi:Family of unknown function (DUF6082)
MNSPRLLERRWLLITLTVVACLAIIGLVAFSPFALKGLQHLSRDWGQLSNIGQTYGAISALISSLALGGVVVSLLYQARDGRTNREQSMRTLHHQLIRMQMEDPALMTAQGAPWNLPIPAESAKIREYLYIHMWVSFWAGNFVMGEMTVPAIKGTAKNDLFNSSAGRRYWVAVGQNLLSMSTGRYNTFFRLIDEEYQKIMASNIPVANPVKITDRSDAPDPRRTVYLKHYMLTGAALVAGMVAGRKLNQWTRKFK